MANTFTFANLTLTDADIFGGINYICDLNTGDEFAIGNTASASVSFVTDQQLPLYTKDQANGTFTWTQDNVSRGRYYITEVTKASGKYEVTAYDAMILLDTSVSALSLTYPLSVSAAASAIAAFIGCTTQGTINNGSAEAADGTIDDTVTCRELLGWVAEASGCSVKIDGSDHICFMYYADSGITVTASDYKEYGLDVADYTCAAIDNVTICDMAGMTSASAGSGTNSLFIQGNPFLYEATSTEAAVILGCVDSFVYAPFTCEMFDENGLEVGTIATFGTTASLVMHIESGETGAVASAVGSDSRAEFNKDLEIVANEALAVATETNLHFWYTASGSEAGAHIAEVDRPTFESSPSGHNVLINSSSLGIRDGADALATFGADGAHIENGSGDAIAHLGYGSGAASGGGTADAPYYTLGQRINGSTVGNWSMVEGNANEASGYCSHAEGRGNYALAECCHAEGGDAYLHSTARFGHAGGYGSIVRGYTSFAHGNFLTADSDEQFVIGCGNKADSQKKYIFIIGNGIGYDDSNALTVDWSGNLSAAGTVCSDYSKANSTDGGYPVTVASLAGNTYLGKEIDLGAIGKRFPIFNGFDISGTGTSLIHTLGHYIYKSGGHWYAYVKMRNTGSSAITNFTVTAYIAWI